METSYKKNWALYLLILYILIGLIIQYNGISQFKSLPSPIYGGDYYYQMGVIFHIREGGNPLVSSSMLGGMPGYLPVYAFLCAKFCDLLNLPTMKGMFLFSLILFVISSLIWFYFFKKIFKDSYIALIGTILANSLGIYPILKYTIFTHQIMIPLFLLFLFLSYKRANLSSFILLGLVYGLLTLSHMVAFVGASIIIFVYFIFRLYKSIKNKNIKSELKNWLVFFMVSLPILMLYWYKPLFVYHLHYPYDRLHMDVIDFSRLSVQINFLVDIIKKYFFNFSSILNIIKTILMWTGIYALFIIKDKIIRDFTIVLIIGSFVATFSYFITEPLFKMHFVPTYMHNFYIWSTSLIIILIGLNYIKILMEKKVNNKQMIETTFIILAILLSINSIKSFINYLQNNRWAQVGKKTMMDVYKSLQKYLLKNTNVNDVILSTKELSFVINSISGRKVMVNRWAHQNDPYINLPQRDMDAAIILYGNDTKKKIELLKKYKVKYLYWDFYWINSEFYFDKKGKLVGMYDPLLTYDTPKNRKYLSKYNVKFIPLYFWVDPSTRYKNVRRYHILIISPQNYHNFTNPWKPNLNKYLKKVWSYKYNGKEIAILYQINITNPEKEK